MFGQVLLAPTTIINGYLDDRSSEQLTELTGLLIPSASYIHLNSRASMHDPRLAEQLLQTRRCIAFIDFDHDAGYAAETTKYLTSQKRDEIAVVAVTASKAPENILQMMRSGCNELLTKPFSNEEFTDLLARINERTFPQANEGHSTRNVIALSGAKNGVGTTTLACHLAYSIVKQSSKKVLLIDHHATLGHVCIYLGLDGKGHEFGELLRNVSRLDRELLRGFVAKHSCGLDVLSSPDLWRATEQISLSKDEWLDVFEVIGSEYDSIIVDCPSPAEQENWPIFDLASAIYLIATPEVASIRDLSRHLDGFMGTPQWMSKQHVVMNRWKASSSAVGIKQIEKALGVPIELKLPDCYDEIVRAENAGTFLNAEKRNDFMMQCSQWSAMVVGDEHTVERDKSARSIFDDLKRLAFS